MHVGFRQDESPIPGPLSRAPSRRLGRPTDRRARHSRSLAVLAVGVLPAVQPRRPRVTASGVVAVGFHRRGEGLPANRGTATGLARAGARQEGPQRPSLPLPPLLPALGTHVVRPQPPPALGGRRRVAVFAVSRFIRLCFASRGLRALPDLFLIRCPGPRRPQDHRSVPWARERGPLARMALPPLAGRPAGPPRPSAPAPLRFRSESRVAAAQLGACNPASRLDVLGAGERSSSFKFPNAPADAEGRRRTLP